MASINKLVAERSDRNQSLKRKRESRGLTFSKNNIEEVTFRRPIISNQKTTPDMQWPIPQPRPTYDPLLLNVKNQIKIVDKKLDLLIKKFDEFSEKENF